jgi:hypothetical protein
MTTSARGPPVRARRVRRSSRSPTRAERTEHNDPDHFYREVLEDLAKRRGLSGAEELAEKAAVLDPRYTAEDLLGARLSGYGEALDRVLETSEEERELLVRAFILSYLGTYRLSMDARAPWREVPRSEMFNRVIVAVDSVRGECLERGDDNYRLYIEESLFPFLEEQKAISELHEMLQELDET